MDRLYVLLASRAQGYGEKVVVQMSFDRQELERMKAAVEAQSGFCAPDLEVAPLDQCNAKFY